MLALQFLQYEEISARMVALQIDHIASKLAKITHIPIEGDRTWRVSKGGVDGGWNGFKLNYVREDARFWGFDYVPSRPYQTGRIEAAVLEQMAGRIVKQMFPYETDWRTTGTKMHEEDQLQPPSYSIAMKGSNTRIDGVRRVDLQIELATGRPLLILVQYADKEKVIDAVTDDHYTLTLTLSSKFVPSP